ncbi:MmyB family transcriptional regulator [Nocardia jiangxiensis]|uniref:MmyB family transcriptional regulator n=1 Tax=Nocardia jiangxiensis TaxID=282685 RepID=UPI0002E80342|nr:helix-turn-helix domain-containing protein [Nocardia jiangxiensis]
MRQPDPPRRRKPHRIKRSKPVLSIPELPLFLGQLRDERELTRRVASETTTISEPYLIQLENGKRHSKPETLDLIVAGYGLTTAQARHAHELLAAPLPLRDIASYRRYLEETPALTDHLTDLGEQHVPAMYLDPLSNVLAVNKPMTLALPGLEDVGNLAIYWFRPIAQQLFPDWPTQADYIVGRLKAGMGRYRTALQARRLLRSLGKSPEFATRWLSSTRIAYNWETSDHIRWRNPNTGEEKLVSVHRAEISEKAVMIMYSAYVNRHTGGPG